MCCSKTMGCGSSAHSTFVSKTNRGKLFISFLKHFQCCFLTSFLSKHPYVPPFSLGHELPDASHPGKLTFYNLSSRKFGGPVKFDNAQTRQAFSHIQGGGHWPCRNGLLCRSEWLIWCPPDVAKLQLPDFGYWEM